MKRVIFVLFVVLGNLYSLADDFKIGDAKYRTHINGTVELKEFKKAAGHVSIPEKVTNPKDGKEYKVTEIGDNAFKKSSLSSIEIPSSVKTIGDGAFKDCINLTEVTLPSSVSRIPTNCFKNCGSLKTLNVDLDSIVYVGAEALYGCPIGPIVPVSYEVKDGKCRTNWGMQPADYKTRKIPIIIHPCDIYDIIDKVSSKEKESRSSQHSSYVNTEELLDKRIRDYYSTWNISDSFSNMVNEKIKEHISVIPKGVKNGVYIFVNPTDGIQAWTFTDELVDSSIKGWIKEYLEKNRTSTIQEFVEGRIEMEYNGNGQKYPKRIVPNYTFYFGIKDGKEGAEVISGPYSVIEAGGIAYENIGREKFMPKLKKLMTIAIEKPENLSSYTDGLDSYECMKYYDELSNCLGVLCDSVYLVKPELSNAEKENLARLVDTVWFYGIRAQDGNSYGSNLEVWAKNDVLNKDIRTGEHKEIYERLLKLIDRYYTFAKLSEDPYHQAMQLAALCGLERWKEAAEYFPKVHCAVTDNGKYPLIPYEITYMQDQINSHGYKTVTPVYKKAPKTSKGGKPTKSTKVKSSNDKESLIEFFMAKAVDAGIERYKQKKAEKKSRELFYESLGLDKKGRPKKR